MTSDLHWFRQRFARGAAEKPASRLFGRIGAPRGLHSGAAAGAELEAEARELFDAAYYLRVNGDVRASAGDPWKHFLAHGWREGRRPFAFFDPKEYASRRMGEAAGRQNSLLHYARFAPGDTAARRLGPDVAELVQTLPRAENPTAAADEELLLNSAWFSADFFAAAMGEKGSRRDLVRRFLDISVTRDCSPCPVFGSEFYRRHYGELPRGAGVEPCRDGDIPLLHFLRHGRARGFYPNAQLARIDAELLRTDAAFLPERYRALLPTEPMLNDPWADYTLYGHLTAAHPFERFSADLMRILYAPLTGRAIRSPRAFYLRHRERPWMHADPDDLEHDAAALRASPFFDARFYGEFAGLDGTTIDPATHFVTVGIFRGFPAAAEFDTERYLALNADVRRTGNNPVLHYERSGRAEGRSRPRAVPDPAPVPVQPEAFRSRRTVLIFAHEASLTGAPIVALNIARELAKRYHLVICVGDSGGPLTDELRRHAVEFWPGWGASAWLHRRLEQLKQRADVAFAIVNSVCCHPVLPSLRAAGIPTVSLIHEFADYVWPAGTLARMAFHSDAAVFPAALVEQSCLREISEMGAVRRPSHFRRRHQGYSVFERGTSSIAAEDLRSALCATDTDRARVLLGVGQIQARKGIDLFIQVASRLRRTSDFAWTFVWVGNCRPSVDFETYVFTQHQIRQSGLSEQFFHFDEQPDLGAFWQLADVFLLSSRLDPFPNVAIDALCNGVPVVCFRGATGAAELEARFPAAVSAVDYADPEAAAEGVEAFARNPEETALGFASCEEALRREMSFEAYVADIESIAHQAVGHSLKVREAARRLAAVSPDDLQDALDDLPPEAQLNLNFSERAALLNLAAQVREPLFADIERAGPEVLPRARGAEHRCDARFGRLADADGGSGPLVHLHFASFALAEALFGSRSVYARTLRAARLVVTAGDDRLRKRLTCILPSSARLLDEDLASPVHALQQAMLYGDDACIVTHCAMMADASGAENAAVFDCLSALVCGAGVDALGADPMAAGVVAARDFAPTSERVRASFEQALPGRPLPRTGAGFSGTYRRSDLSAFLEDWCTVLRRASLTMSPSEAGVLAACLYQDRTGARGGHLLRALPGLPPNIVLPM